MEYKQICFKADVLDEEQGIFEGYASVFGNLDSVGILSIQVPSPKR